MILYCTCKENDNNGIQDVFVRVQYKQNSAEDKSQQNKIIAVNENPKMSTHKVYDGSYDNISDVIQYTDVALSEKSTEFCVRKDDFIHDKDYDINTTKDEYYDSIVSRFQYDPACQFCEGKARHDIHEPMFICLHSLRQATFKP